MTDYERRSIELAEQALAASNASALASGIYTGIAAAALVASIVAAVVIYHQLVSQRWMSLLSFEQDMHARRSAFVNIGQELSASGATPLLAEMVQAELEGYLNAVDRLASSILNGQFPMKEMKQDYRDYITNVVREFPEKFQAGTPYRKTLKLYNKWQD